MKAASWIFGGVLLVAAAVAGWLLFYALPSRYNNRPSQQAAQTPDTKPPEGRRIKARLFYVADDGVKLQSVEQEVAYGEGTLEQARAIMAAQLRPVASPLLSAIPQGTLVRAIFVTKQGEAFVDFSPELRSEHPGGSLNELLTIYTIVNALTTNLPVIKAVQVLVDGKEVDTLAGHVDLRRPLPGNPAWVE